MQNRKPVLSLIISAVACAAFAAPAHSQTVDQLLASDAQQAAANEQAAAEKAEKAAREAAGLPPSGVVAAAPVKAVHHRLFDLVSIFGLSGQRKVVFKVDGKQIELDEPGGQSKGYQLVAVDGTCATVGDVHTYRHTSNQKRKAHSLARSTHTVCYVKPLTFLSQNMRTGGFGGALPAPLPLGMPPSEPIISQVRPESVPQPRFTKPAPMPTAISSPILSSTPAAKSSDQE